MTALSLGVIATSRKPDEHRLAIHPEHLSRIDPALRARIYLDTGTGCRSTCRMIASRARSPGSAPARS